MRANESITADVVVERLLAAVRQARASLRAYPKDLPSIVPNQIAAAASPAVDWPAIESIVRDRSARPFLRFERSFDLPVDALSVARRRHGTASAVATDLIVVGTETGQLLMWRTSDLQVVPPSVSAHRGRIAVLAFVGREEVVRLSPHLSETTGDLLSGGSDGDVHLWARSIAELPLRLVRTFAGHTSEVTGVALGGADRVVAAARDGSIRVWDRESGRALSTFVGHTGPVTALHASLDHSVLVSGSTDGTLRVWDVMAGRVRAILRGHRGPITGCVIVDRPDFVVNRFRILSASTDGLLKLWTPNGEDLGTLGGHSGPVRDVQIALDGRVAITGGDDGTVRVWDLDERRETRVVRGHTGPVSRVVAFASPARRLLSASHDGTCRISDVESGRLVRAIRISSTPITALSISDTANVAVCMAEDGAIARVDLMQSGPAEGDRAGIRVALNKTGDQLMVTADRTLRFVRDLDNVAAALPDYAANTYQAVAMNFTADVFVTLGRGGRIQYWSQQGIPIGVYTVAADTRAIGLSPSGSLLLTGLQGGELHIWRREGAGLTQRGSFAGDSPVQACASDMSDRRAVSAHADGSLGIWDLQTNRVIAVIRAHDRAALDCDMAHDGTFVISASADRTIKVWDVATGQPRLTLEGHTGAVNACWIGSRLDRALSCSDDGTVKLWDLAEGRCLETFYGDAPFISLSLAPGAPLMAVADAAAKIWILRHTFDDAVAP